MLPGLPDESRPAELGQVEGKRGIWHAQSLSDRAGRHSLLAGLNEKSEQRETMLLRQRSEGGDRPGRIDLRFCFHDHRNKRRPIYRSILISRIVEHQDEFGPPTPGSAGHSICVA